MSMAKYFIKFSYNGSFYRGAAKQSGRHSVLDIDSIQGILETATQSLSPTPKCAFVTLGSRTDSGVHALDAAATLKIETNSHRGYDSTHLIRSINRFLSRTKHPVRILQCLPVSQNLLVRSVIKSRTYTYRFMTPKFIGEKRQPIFEILHSHYIRSDSFDIERLERGMQLFMGRKNFMTFAASKPTKYPIMFERCLNELRLEKAQPLTPFDALSDNYYYWHVICSANSFLYQQVRRIVGTLFALAEDKISEKDINIMLTVPSHAHYINVPAPANGLYLVKTECDEDCLNAHVLSDEIYQNISTNLTAQ